MTVHSVCSGVCTNVYIFVSVLTVGVLRQALNDLRAEFGVLFTHGESWGAIFGRYNPLVAGETLGDRQNRTLHRSGFVDNLFALLERPLLCGSDDLTDASLRGDFHAHWQPLKSRDFLDSNCFLM